MNGHGLREETHSSAIFEIQRHQVREQTNGLHVCSVQVAIVGYIQRLQIRKKIKNPKSYSSNIFKIGNI